MNRKELIYIPAAMAIGGGLWFVMNMNPVWWLAWFLPGLLFAIALRTEAWTSRGLVALAALIGASSNLGYFIKVMPLVPTMIVLLLLTLVWVVVFGAARRIPTSYKRPSPSTQPRRYSDSWFAAWSSHAKVPPAPMQTTPSAIISQKSLRLI